MIIYKFTILCKHGAQCHVIQLLHNIFIVTVTSYNHKTLIDREMHAWHLLLILLAHDPSSFTYHYSIQRSPTPSLLVVHSTLASNYPL